MYTQHSTLISHQKIQVCSLKNEEEKNSPLWSHMHTDFDLLKRKPKEDSFLGILAKFKMLHITKITIKQFAS